MNWIRQILLPLTILVAGLCVTWVAWDHERDASHKELRAQFDFSLREAVSRVEQRVSSYEQMLHGVQGLFAATGKFDRAVFRDYVASLNLDANFSGIQAIGAEEWIPNADKTAHIARMHELGFTGYAIRPAGERPDYAPIVMREPYVSLNRMAFGFDPWAETNRRRAMEKARDSGLAAISGKVKLDLDADGKGQPSFLMYLPIYARGKPQSTIAERRANLIGWVHASFRMSDVIASLYGEQPMGVAFAIYDGVEPSTDALLYHSAAGLDQKKPTLIGATEYLVVAGHNWTLAMNTLDDFSTRFDRNAEVQTALTGVGLSMLLALLAWLLMSSRRRAIRLANKMTSELRASEEQFRAIADCTVNWEVWWGLDGKPRWINPSVFHYTGYTVEECMAMPNFKAQFIYLEDLPRVVPEFDKGLLGQRGDDLEFRCVRKDGSLFWLSISWVPITDANGVFTGFRTSGRDITERKISEERIRELAFFDALTRLPNRTLLLDRLKQAIAVSTRNKTSSALLFIDLDHFKTLNDTLGHDKGDLLLKQVAQRLALSVRANDTVARVGGDEFVVVLESLHHNPQEAANQTKAIGEKILNVLDSPYQLDDVEYRSTASVGATVFRGHQAPIDELLKQADLAMYKSKETGRNTMNFFDPAMQTVVLERAALEAGLRKAIDGGQLVLHYQAQVLESGRVTGAEVLVRWQHPQRGTVLPSEFIPLAEETGLILSLGNWVMETACTQLARWAQRAETAHLSIAVNVSAQQFREADFVETVCGIIERTGANPMRLKLELTESLLVDNVEDIIQKMYALKAKGVEFSLDDFGIGYSSLSYLKRLPLNQLKIDQSFVRDVLIDPNDASIAKTIVALAQSLGLGVIAEGVETDAQRNFLADAGCHAYQGYFFCRPLPLDGFEQFVHAFDPILDME